MHRHLTYYQNIAITLLLAALIAPIFMFASPKPAKAQVNDPGKEALTGCNALTFDSHAESFRTASTC